MGGKTLGNVDLYYAVLWRLVGRGNLPWLYDVFSQMSAQMKERLLTRKSSLSMTGMANLISTRRSLGTAVWFVLASGVLKMDNEVVPLRAHVFVADTLLELTKLVDYIVTDNMWTAVRMTRQLMVSLSECKRDFSAFVDSRRILTRTYLKFDQDSDSPINDIPIRDMNRIDDYYSRLNNTGFIFVFTDDVSTNPDNGNLVVPHVGGTVPGKFDCTVKEIVYIANQVHPSMSASSLTVPTADDIRVWWDTVGCKPITSWPMVTDRTMGLSIKHKSVYIHPATCRPQCVVQLNGRDTMWMDSYADHYGHSPLDNPSRTISGNKTVGLWITQHGRWPTAKEIVLHMYHIQQRANASGKENYALLEKRTLSNNVWENVVATLADYKDIFETLTPEIFKKRFTDSVARTVRLAMEQTNA